MRGVWFVLKIHIVRKGDTLWEIAKQYGVDFEELKKSNPQLSSPDMIMPGMKIKIPSGTKSVKKETAIPKETKVPTSEKEKKKQAPKIKEDDHEKPKEVKMEMPKKHIPTIPPTLQTPQKEVPIVKEQHQVPIKETPKVPVKPMKEMIKMPVMEEQPKEKPKTSEPKKPKKEEKIHEQKPVGPICYHYYHHCCPPFFHPCHPVMNEMPGGFMPQHHHMEKAHTFAPMPIMPQQNIQPQPCGCHGIGQQMQPFQMREYMPEPGVNVEPLGVGYQPQMNQTQVYPAPEQQATHSFEKPFPFPPSYPTYSNDHTREVEQTDDDQ